MILALLIPFYEAWKDDNVWQKMLAFSSIATKTSVMILLVSVLRDDWMIGVVGVIILSVGNAALMLLAHVLKRMSDVSNELFPPAAPRRPEGRRS
jgi:multicomponent Na+:H+ antiporter subunit F